MTKLNLILTLNDPHDAQPDPNWPSQCLRKKFVLCWDSNLENFTLIQKLKVFKTFVCISNVVYAKFKFHSYVVPWAENSFYSAWLVVIGVVQPDTVSINGPLRDHGHNSRHKERDDYWIHYAEKCKIQENHKHRPKGNLVIRDRHAHIFYAYTKTQCNLYWLGWMKNRKTKPRDAIP